MKICIIGGGIAGVISAIVCLSYGFEILIIEKQRDFGGCWINYANKETRLQTLSELYNLYYILLSNKNNIDTNYKNFKRKDILYIIQTLAKEYQLEKYTLFNVTVHNIREIQKKYKIITPTKSYIADAVLVCSGYLSIPRQLILSNFSKEIQYAHQLKPETLINKNVLIIGWGSYAIQSLITADKYNAKTITLMGRNAKWIWPYKYHVLFFNIFTYYKYKFALFFVSLFICSYYIYHGCYRYIPNKPFNTFNYLPCVNNDFFKLHKKKNINYTIDTIQFIENNIVYTKNKKQYKPDIIILGIGFHTEEFNFIDKSIRPDKLYKSIYPLKTDRMGIIGIPHGLFSPYIFREQAILFCKNLKNNTSPTYKQKLVMKTLDTSRIITYTDIIKCIYSI